MSELKVGFLVIVAMASIVSTSLLVTSRQSGFWGFTPYRSVIRNASGIFPKTPIKIAGVEAGRIKTLHLKGNQVEVVFEVKSSITIPRDSRLVIKSVGLFGDKYLEIVVGNDPKELEKMGLMKAEEPSGLVGIADNAVDAINDLKTIIREFKETLIPGTGDSVVKQVADNIVSATSDMKKSFAEMNRLISGNSKKINAIVDNVERFAEELSLQANINNEDSAIAGVERILQNTEKLTSDLKQVIADVRSGKGTAGKFLVEEDIADEVKETLSGVKRLVSKGDNLRAEFFFETGSNNDFGAETSAAFNLVPSPERFYRLGMTTSEFGPEEEEHTTTTTVGSGAVENEIKRKKTKGEILLNVQVGRKIHDWSFRGGLIESTGGMGVDYTIAHMGAKFTLDMFDYRDDKGVNVRPAYTQKIWNVFYGKVVVEDAVRSDRSYTLSAGLRFNDEDLKSMLGFFL